MATPMIFPAAIHVEFIEHSAQDYPTVGNWQLKGNAIKVLLISVSKTKTPLYQYLVAIHELVEALACCVCGVTQQDVDDFDLEWERRVTGQVIAADQEPGDSLLAPYHRQHQLASLVERTVAFFLGVDWADYESEITALWNTTREQ